MRNGLLFVAVLCLLLPWAGFAGPAQTQPDAAPAALPSGDAQAKMAPELRAELVGLPPGDMLTVIVTLSAQAGLDQAMQAGAADRAARLRGVITALQATAAEAQKPIRTLLATRQSQGLAGPVTHFWVFDGLAVTATGDVIRELAARPDVAKITPDAIQVVPASQPAGGLPEPNLSVVNAPALWALGLLGQGIVVANMDTGVDAGHPDLAPRWRGGSNSWYDPYGQHPTVPTDLAGPSSGHGTWTMGAMVGGDAGGTAIGVAPGAQWIAVKIFNDAGSATATAIHLGFQWLLDPDGNPATADAPHVVNNSWTLVNPGCNLEFEADLEALRAVGILPVFAAGNSGPNPGTSLSPANNPAAFAVGATNDSDLIYAYSSRGPSSCGDPGTIYPELVAPGVFIRTTGLYGSYYDATGTSLAAPHVAGGLALLLSAYPDLPDFAQENVLLDGAVDLGPVGPDNNFGHGRLDVLASYQGVGPGADLAISKSDAFDPVYTSATLTYTLLVTNAGPDTATAATVTDELPRGVTYGGVSGDGWNCDHSGGVVTCTRSSFSTGAAPGIVITVTAPVSNGTITNTAVVTSTTTDPLPANNTDAEQTRVIVPGAEQADLAITATDNPDPVNASAPLTYTLAVSNSGLDTAVVVTVTDLLPSRAAFGSVSGEGWNCDHAGGVVTCSRPTLAVGVAPGIVIAVAAPASGGTISNTAWVTSTTTDPDLTDNASTEQTIVTPPAAEQADLSIAKADGPDPVSASATLIYTLTVSNGGPYTATDVTVIDMLPPEVTFGGVLGDGWNCDHAGGKVTCGRSDLGVMTAPDIVISVTAPQSGGMIINGVVVSGQEVDPNLEDNTATAYTQVNSVAVHHLVYLPLIVK